MKLSSHLQKVIDDNAPWNKAKEDPAIRAREAIDQAIRILEPHRSRKTPHDSKTKTKD